MTEIAERFIREIRNGGPVTLVAINPDRVMMTPEQAEHKGIKLDWNVQRIYVATFGKSNLNKLADWLDLMNRLQQRNIYFHANPLRKQSFNRRARAKMREDEFELDVAAFQYVAGDFDRPKDSDFTAKAWEDHVRARLTALKKFSPSFIWFTGGGVQALWRIKPPAALHDDDDVARAQRVCLGLLDNIEKATGLKSDDVASIEHIFRLPGTINYPNESKRKAGRVTVKAGDFTSHDHVYRASELPIAKAKPKPADALALVDPIGGWDHAEEMQWAMLHVSKTEDLSREGVQGAAWRTALILRDHGIHPDTAFDLMREHWAVRCEYQWDEDELRDKIVRAYASAENDPGCKTRAYAAEFARREFSKE